MTDAQLERCRKRLEQFLVDLLEPVGRSERRNWGGVYVRGLLLDGERKSVGPMAQRLPDGNEQAMQQLVGQSPWDWEPVWKRLAQRMVRELEPDAVWVIDDTGFPKQGWHFGRSRTPVFRDARQDRPLPGRRESAGSVCGRGGSAEWAVSAGELGPGGIRRDGRKPGFPRR